MDRTEIKEKVRVGCGRSGAAALPCFGPGADADAIGRAVGYIETREIRFVLGLAKAIRQRAAKKLDEAGADRRPVCGGQAAPSRESSEKEQRPSCR
jgi:hypothetical protein